MVEVVKTSRMMEKPSPSLKKSATEDNEIEGGDGEFPKVYIIVNRK